MNILIKVLNLKKYKILKLIYGYSENKLEFVVTFLALLSL